jgi:hypothetical protein
MIDDAARIMADKHTDLDGRKDLSLGDYKPGQTVKVSCRVSDRRVLEVRLKRPKSQEPRTNARIHPRGQACEVWKRARGGT